MFPLTCFLIFPICWPLRFNKDFLAPFESFRALEILAKSNGWPPVLMRSTDSSSIVLSFFLARWLNCFISCMEWFPALFSITKKCLWWRFICTRFWYFILWQYRFRMSRGTVMLYHIYKFTRPFTTETGYKSGKKLSLDNSIYALTSSKLIWISHCGHLISLLNL